MYLINRFVYKYIEGINNIHANIKTDKVEGNQTNA